MCFVGCGTAPVCTNFCRMAHKSLHRIGCFKASSFTLLNMEKHVSVAFVIRIRILVSAIKQCSSVFTFLLLYICHVPIVVRRCLTLGLYWLENLTTYNTLVSKSTLRLSFFAYSLLCHQYWAWDVGLCSEQLLDVFAWVWWVCKCLFVEVYRM